MDRVSEAHLAALLGNGFEVRVTESAVSTNTALDEAARHGAPAGSVLVAHSQQGGRGRLGRSFSSQLGGLYMSVLLRPECDIATACLITPVAANAVADAVEAVLGINLDVKWVNDLFFGGKKVCGILAESGGVSSNGTVGYIVVGIGLNVYEPCGGFPSELSEIAAALLPSGTNTAVMDCLAAEIVRRVFKYAQTPQSKELYQAYKRRLFILGKTVTVHRGSTEFTAKVCELNDDYTLTVETEDGARIRLLSGEVSLRCF